MNLSVSGLHAFPSWLEMPDMREVSIQKLVTCQRIFVNSILNLTLVSLSFSSD